MYCMAHDCFYPALGLFSCYESRLHDLGITKDKRYKVHFEEKVLNHFITQEQK